MRSLFIPIAALALAGCAGPVANGAGLTGSQWRIVSIDGAAAVSPDAMAAFERDRLSATVGCNRMSGQWRVEAGRLIAGPLMQTRMGCPGPVGAQENALSTLLAAAPRVTLSGDRLTLASSGHAAQLVRSAN